jgi:hypothetical protein
MLRKSLLAGVALTFMTGFASAGTINQIPTKFHGLWCMYVTKTSTSLFCGDQWERGENL